MCVYISLISFFASPSVPPVSRTCICTSKLKKKKKKMKKKPTHILPRARTHVRLFTRYKKTHLRLPPPARHSRFHTRHPLMYSAS